MIVRVVLPAVNSSNLVAREGFRQLMIGFGDSIIGVSAQATDAGNQVFRNAETTIHSSDLQHRQLSY